MSFNATPTIFGECKFGIIVRNGEGTGSLYWNLNTTSTTYIIGSDAYPGGWAAAFKGTISHVAIYNKALTAAEVWQNFNVARTI